MGSARAHGGAGPSLARACRPLGFSVSYQRLVRVIVIRYGRVLFRGLYSVLRDTALDSSLAIHGAYGASLVAHRDRKSTRLNSSHVAISYAVFCLKKKKK